MVVHTFNPEAQGEAGRQNLKTGIREMAQQPKAPDATSNRAHVGKERTTT